MNATTKNQGMDPINYLKARLLCEKLRVENPDYLVLCPDEDPTGQMNLGQRISEGGPMLVAKIHKKRQEKLDV